jgi:hypothetical protein
MSDQVTPHQWPPLTDEERQFIAFWEKERSRRRKWIYPLLHNLPMGLLFGFPIALFFLLEAPRHRSLISHADLILIMICVILIAVFYALFRGYTRWDQYESHYKILKMKDDQQGAAAPLSHDR